MGIVKIGRTRGVDCGAARPSRSLIDTFVYGFGSGTGGAATRVADLADQLHTKQPTKTPPPMKAAELLHAQCVTSSAAGTG